MNIKPEYLLAHADFVRILARRLILDKDIADDLAQETLLKALEKPPNSESSLSTWLTTVIKNHAYTLNVSNQRREKYEKAAAIEDLVPSTEDILERENIRNQVVESVLGLEKIYKDAIVLRYYENMPPREIASRLDLPVETIRSRLKRGHSQLKDKLNKKFGNDGISWITALLPVAGLSIPLASAAAATVAAKGASSALSSGGSSLVSNLSAMSIKAKLASAALLVIGMAIVISSIVITLDFDHSDRDLSAIEEYDQLNNASAVNVTDDKYGSVLKADSEVKETIKPVKTRVELTVLNVKTSEKVEGFYLLVQKEVEEITSYAQTRNEDYIRDTIDLKIKPCIFEVDSPELYHVTVIAKGFISCLREPLNVISKNDLQHLTIELNPGSTVSGRVIDEKNEPVVDAIVGPPINRYLYALMTKPLLYGLGIWGNYTRTDEEGFYEIGGLNPEKRRIVALHPDYAIGINEIKPGDTESTFRLERGYCIYGKVFTNMGSLLVWVDNRPVLTDENGNYRTPPIAPCKRMTSLAIESDLGPYTGRCYAESRKDYFQIFKKFKITDGDIRYDFDESNYGKKWTGRLTVNSIPIPNIKIFLNCENHKAQYFVYTDSEGKFTFNNLIFDKYKLSVKYSKICEFTSPAKIIDLRPKEPLNLDIEYETDRLITGNVYFLDSNEASENVTVSPCTNDPKLNGYSCKHRVKTDAKGNFSLLNINPGHIEIGVDNFKVLKVQTTLIDEGVVDGDKYCFDLNKDEQMVNMDIYISGSPAKINVKISGFTSVNNSPDKLIYNFTMDNGVRFFNEYKVVEIDSCGRWSRIIESPPLDNNQIYCTAEFTANNIVFKKRFQIVSGDCTDLEFALNEFDQDRRWVPIEGKVVRPDGSPMSNTDLLFLRQNNDKISNDTSLKCTTDSEGYFNLSEQFLPPMIKVAICYDNNIIIIPASISNEGYTKIVAPDDGTSKIRGALFDETTNLPYNPSDYIESHISVILYNNYRKYKILWNHVNNFGEFEFNNVFPGNYYLRVKVDHYKQVNIGDIKITKDETLDLNIILMERIK